MRVVNRTAISLVGEKPFVEWTRGHDADANKGTLTVARAKPYGTVVLLPEFELEEDIQEWVEDNASWLFELQLASSSTLVRTTSKAKSSSRTVLPAAFQLFQVVFTVSRLHFQL